MANGIQYVLFTGDDVGGLFTRKFYVTIDTELDLTDCVVQFTICGVTKVLMNVSAGERKEIIFSRVETASFGVGVRLATLSIFDPQGRYRTIANDIPVRCTDVVSDVYDGENNLVRYSLDCGVAWDAISGKPQLATPEEVRTLADGIEVDDNATQRETRAALQTLLDRIRNFGVACLALFALPLLALPESTEWQDVPPTSKVSSVVREFSPPADFTTNNVELTNTIAKVAPAPGNYNAVSNAAMNAVTTNAAGLLTTPELRFGDGTISASTPGIYITTELGNWLFPNFVDFESSDNRVMRRSDLTAALPGNYAAVSNAAMSALSVTGGTMLGDIDMGGRHADGENEPEDSAFVKFMEYWLGYGELGSGFGIYEYSDGFLNVKYTFNGSGWLSEYGDKTDVMTREDLADALGSIPQPELSQYAKLYALEAVSNKVETTATIVDSWEGYWGATNVELRVTNYYGNTTGALPRLQIREYRDGHWTNVWDEIDKFIACKAEILHEVAQSNATLLAEADRKYAPKAWGTYTDKGTTNVIPNSVYMTSPETYFGGGTEFQRVAVGSGAVSVLVDRGALAKTTGEPGTFRFQDAGGTNYFGFVKSDSYTIGCRTDGISVGAGNAITLRYDVIMAGEDVPVVYWKQKLESATPWAQLNNPDGTAADGAPYSVTWLQDGGSYYATVNCGGSPSGFFVAETSVAGDVVWETNMKARLGGGIECTNTATHVNGVIRPKYNGSTVTWEWSAR